MGYDFEPVNNAVETFSVNVCQMSLLGALHAACGAQMRKVTQHYTEADKWRDPLVPFRATKEEAQAMAYAINIAELDTWLTLYNNPKWGNGKLFEGSFKEFGEFVFEWTHFLNICGGYTILG